MLGPIARWDRGGYRDRFASGAWSGWGVTNRTRIGTSVAVTVLFLWLAVRNVDVGAAKTALSEANYSFLLPAAICTIVGFWIRAIRWNRILAPMQDIPAQRLFPIMMVGFAANNIIPARIGELARIYLTGSRERVSRTGALATLIVERVCDGVTLLAMLTVTLTIFPVPADERGLRTVILVATVVFGLATVMVTAMLVVPSPFFALGQRVAKRLPVRFGGKVEGLMESFLLGLQSLRGPRALAEIAVLSLGAWMMEWATYAFVLLAFPLGLSWAEWLAAATFLVVFVNLGIMLPSAPGYVGTYQFFATLALGAFGVGASSAFSLALVAHAMQYVLITSTGLLCLSRLGLTPARLGKLAPARRTIANEPST